MRYWLLDILACPMCKNFPLELHVFDEKLEEGDVKLERVPCELYCGLQNITITKEVDKTELLKKCRECMKINIVNALLVCKKCQRWYPVIDEIPHMLPDKLRDKNKELGFLHKFREKVPTSILQKGKPFHL